MSSASLCVIGGGASGIMAAITAARAGSAVTVFDGNNQICKKILSTGNGRCNYTNTKMDSDLFYGEDPSFVLTPLSVFGVEDTIKFFEEIGIIAKEKNGYIYPRSLQAESVKYALEKEVNRLNIKLILESPVTKISKTDTGFRIYSHDKSYEFDKVIIACGGKAAPKSGSDGSIFEVLKELQIESSEVLPALVPLISNDQFLKGLSGVRSECKIDFYVENDKIFERSGEIQFTDFGISGIVVFDGSNRLSKALYNNHKCYVKIDFAPELSFTECKNILAERANRNIPLLNGFLNSKLSDALCKSVKIKNNHPNDKEILELTKQIKGAKINIIGTKDFDRAQVSTGGVLTSNINKLTMEYNKIPGLYFAGEILDVDGPCGGYNLQWAFTSGYIAGKNAAI